MKEVIHWMSQSNRMEAIKNHISKKNSMHEQIEQKLKTVFLFLDIMSSRIFKGGKTKSHKTESKALPPCHWEP